MHEVIFFFIKKSKYVILNRDELLGVKSMLGEER